jgi:hypothetical protein
VAAEVAAILLDGAAWEVAEVAEVAETILDLAAKALANKLD